MFFLSVILNQVGNPPKTIISGKIRLLPILLYKKTLRSAIVQSGVYERIQRAEFQGH